MLLLSKKFINRIGFAPFRFRPAPCKGFLHRLLLQLKCGVIRTNSGCGSGRTLARIFLMVKESMWQVGLHQFYLGASKYAPIAEIALPTEEPPTGFPIGGEILYKGRFATERSSAWYCSASFLVIFIQSILISCEYAITP